MSSVVDIPWPILGLFFLTLSVPLSISRYYQLNIGKDALIGVARMTLQLALVGVYLEYLFDLNSALVNVLWLAVMILIGASSIINKARLPRRPLMAVVTTSLIVGLTPVLLIITALVVRPTPFYHAQYLIPLAGMLLGNSLSGNIVALQHFYTAFEQRNSEYQAAISLGAPPSFATLPFVREAIQKSVAPTLASMTTSGLVTLPGMMTGQILGGASPIIAIKYQVMIMVAIFVMMTISITTTLRLNIAVNFSQSGQTRVKRIEPEQE